MKSIPIQIKSSNLEDRVRKYLKLLHHFHGLTDKELDILVELILKYYEITTKVTDIKMVNQLLFSVDTKREIKKKLNIKDPVFQNYMTAFRKKQVIKDSGINLSYIPPREQFEIKFLFL